MLLMQLPLNTMAPMELPLVSSTLGSKTILDSATTSLPLAVNEDLVFFLIAGILVSIVGCIFACIVCSKYYHSRGGYSVQPILPTSANTITSTEDRAVARSYRATGSLYNGYRPVACQTQRSAAPYCLVSSAVDGFTDVPLESRPHSYTSSRAHRYRKHAIEMEPRSLIFTQAGGVSGVTLTNVTETRVAIKIKCSDNDLYKVSPVFAVVEPNSDLDLRVFRGCGGFPKEDKLVISYASVNENGEFDPTNLFDKNIACPSMELPLRVFRQLDL